MVDRGSQPKKVVEEMMNLKKNYPDKVKIIQGNHEEMFLDWLEIDSVEHENWYLTRGGLQTIGNYCEDYAFVHRGNKAKQIVLEYYQEHIEFLQNLEQWHEDENHIFVHAGINQSLSDWKTSSEKHLRWDRKMFFNEKNETGKIIVFGHTQTYLLHHDQSSGVWFQNENLKKIGIDGGCVYGEKLHCLEINDCGYKVYSV